MAKLIITGGPDAGLTVHLAADAIGVGRGEGNAVRLTDLTVSRHHFRIEPDRGRWRLVDQGSRNRTVVNATPVAEHSLTDGDRIFVGSTQLLFADENEASLVGAELDLLPAGFEKVTVEISGLSATAAGLERLGRLYHFAAEVSSIERLRALYTAVARRAREACDADRVFLFIRDREGELAVTGRAAVEGEAARVSVSSTVVDKVLREGKSVVVADAYGDLQLQQQPSIVENAIRSVMCAPVVSRGRVLGLLYVDRRRETPGYGDADLQFLTALAQQAGIAVDNLILRDALVEENAHLRSRVAADADIVGDSEPVQRVLHFVQKVAPTDSTVLLTGESGTGKELVAQAVHRGSRRASGPFIAVNCAALTESLLESELFGHEKGAFTGATSQKKGRFELADGGTLFLDEVGELNTGSQTKLLRVLEESAFRRVGGERNVKVDVRVVAATHRDLQAMVAEGSFRDDLFYRLQVLQIEMPPLRERRGDVKLLVRHYVQRYAHKLGRRIEAVEPTAMDAMRGYRWPGNVRELKNAIERAMVLGDGKVLRLADLPPSIGGSEGAPRVAAAQTQPDMPAMSLRALEQRAILAALQATEGNKKRAAELLEIDRSTLYKKIKEYGIET